MTTAYHGSQELKAAIVAEMRRHAQLETLVQGTYQEEDGSGCFVGCLIGSANHAAAMERIGAPIALGRLCDVTFEGLPIDRARAFAVDILEAIKVGADLSVVTDHMMLWTMNRLLAMPDVTDRQNVKSCIETVAGLYRRKMAGDHPTDGEWESAAEAAARAAARAGWAARDAAEAAARAAARAGWAARDAAEAAARAAAQVDGAARAAGWAWAAARTAFWQDFAAEMIRVIKEAA